MSVIVAVPPPAYRAWDPTARQVAEPDTTLLFDPAAEALLAPAEGGFQGDDVYGTALPPWLGGTRTEVMPGRYRDGIRALHASGFIWAPMAGLLGGTFTIEHHLNAVDFAALTNETPLILSAQADTKVEFFWFEGVLKVTVAQGQQAVSGAELLAPGTSFTDGEPNSVALTLDGAGALVLYLNGAAVDDGTFIAPYSWTEADGNANGLCIGGGPGRGAVSQTISDLRISRLARVPGEVPEP